MSSTSPDPSLPHWFSAVSPILIGFLPLALHIIDKLLEMISPIGEELVRRHLANDGRAAVASVGSADLFNAVKTFFDYAHAVRFVFVFTIFNILSLYFAQVECMKSFLSFRWETLAGMIFLIVYMVMFLLRLLNQAYDPATPFPLRQWTISAYAAFALISVLEICLHLSCAEKPHC